MNKLNAIGVHVARWKIETQEELELSYKADWSIYDKKVYCDFYRRANPDYYNTGVSMAKKVIKKHGLIAGLTEDYIIQDMIYNLHRFGFNYDEYYWFKLYNLSTVGREGFISDKMRFEYYMKLNSPEGMNILRDKWRAYQRMKQFYKRDCCAVYSEDGKTDYMNFVNQHSSFFYKPLASDSAKNCCVIHSDDVTFECLINAGPFVIEELIVQSGDFAGFYPEAVNLIRIPVLTTKDGEVHLMGPFLTLGQNGMKAVNAGQGGIVATIDPDSGVVIGNGWVEGNETEFYQHPQSKKTINGYKIPDWDSAVNICKEASKFVPECRYIGFDLAQTDKGWVIIEANCYAQFLGQRNTTGLRRKMLDYLKCV